MAKKNPYGPYTARPGKSGPPRLLYLAIGLGGVFAAAGLFYLLAPDSLARLHGRFFGRELAILGLTLELDGGQADIPPGGSIKIHPRRDFSLKTLRSNRWRNYDLTLHSPDFDIARISGGLSGTVLQLAGEEAAESGAPLRLEAREGEAVKAVFEIIPAYTAVDLAALAEAAGSPARKADLYQRAFLLEPASQPLREALINALSGAGRKAEAAAMLEEDAAGNGAARPILERLLGLYTDIADNEKRAGALSRLIALAREEGGEEAPYQASLADLYKEMEKPNDAAKVYEEMFIAAPDDGGRVRALTSLRALYRDFGMPGQEIAAIKRLLEFSPEGRAAALWTEIIAIYETLSDAEGQASAWLGLAQILSDGENRANAYKRAAWLSARAGKNAEAAQAYHSALLLDPFDINIHLNLGRLASAEGKRAAYRTHLKKALEISPGRDDLRRELAAAFYDDGLKADAGTEYEAILAKDPDDTESRLRLIAILEEAGGRDGRLRGEYAALMAAQADNRVAAYNLAVLDFRGEKWDEAISGFKKVLELEPGDLDARGYLFSAYEKKGDKKNMLAEALEIYRRDPGRRDYRELLVNSLENAADWAGLLAAGEEFIKLDSRDVEAWRLLSRAQARLGKPVEAAQSLYGAAEAVGGKDLWLSAAEAMSVQNQLEKAKAAYQKILEIDPENKRAAEGLLDISLRAVGGGGGS